MIEIRQTADYRRWFEKLRDWEAQRRILVRVRRLIEGNAGDAKALGGSVSELRVDYGPGYRVYFTWKGATLVLLLAGGDKRTQKRDIEVAKTLAAMPLE